MAFLTNMQLICASLNGNEWLFDEIQ